MSSGSSSSPDPSITTGTNPVVQPPFTIGDCRIEPEQLRVVRDDDTCKLEPMAMRLLVFLARRPTEIVSRAEILDAVWEGRAVVDETLSRAVSLVRQALGDDAQNPRFIETVPKRGYRVIAPVMRQAVTRQTVTRQTVTPESEQASPSAATSASGDPSKTALHRWRLPAFLAILATLIALGWSARQSARDAEGAPSAIEVPRRPGIAVLPFKDLSPNPGSAYLADGLTEELIHQLAGVAGLRVVSRTSSMTFRDSDATAPEIARSLGVDYLLEGTVLVVEQRLRITAQLIRPERDEHLMSRSYDRDFSEVLDLQREVASNVVEQTRIQLSPMEASRLTRGRPIDTAAYRSYLQGLQAIQQRNGLDRGLDLLQRAVELEPSFAPAWATLAYAHLLSNSYLGRPADDAYAGAETAIDKALALDAELASAHAALGLLRVQRERDWAGSESSYRRAIALEPSHVTAHQWYSELLSLLNRHEEALTQIEIATELDPLSPLVHAAAAQRLNAAGRHAESLRRSHDAEALGARFRWLDRERAWALQRLGRDDEALSILVDLAKRRPYASNAPSVASEQARPIQSLSSYYEWEVESLLAQTAIRPGYPTWVAAAYAGLGQDDEALQWLAKAVSERNMWLVHSVRDPAFDGLRDDPRFASTLDDIPPWRPETASPSRGL